MGANRSIEIPKEPPIREDDSTGKNIQIEENSVTKDGGQSEPSKIDGGEENAAMSKNTNNCEVDGANSLDVDKGVDHAVVDIVVEGDNVKAEESPEIKVDVADHCKNETKQKPEVPEDTKQRIEPPVAANAATIESKKEEDRFREYITRRGSRIVTDVHRLQGEINKLRSFALKNTSKIRIVAVCSYVPHQGHLRSACNQGIIMMPYDFEETDPEEILEVVARALTGVSTKLYSIGILCTGFEDRFQIVKNLETSFDLINSDASLQEFWKSFTRRISAVHLLSCDLYGNSSARLLKFLDILTGVPVIAPINIVTNDLRKQQITKTAKSALCSYFDPLKLVEWQLLVMRNTPPVWIRPKAVPDIGETVSVDNSKPIVDLIKTIQDNDAKRLAAEKAKLAAEKAELAAQEAAINGDDVVVKKEAKKKKKKVTAKKKKVPGKKKIMVDPASTSSGVI